MSSEKARRRQANAELSDRFVVRAPSTETKDVIVFSRLRIELFNTTTMYSREERSHSVDFKRCELSQDLIRMEGTGRSNPRAMAEVGVSSSWSAGPRAEATFLRHKNTVM